MASHRATAVLICVMMALAGCASARQLQQPQTQQQPGQVDLGGVFNQIGQAASQGLQTLVNNNQQNRQQGNNASRPLAGLGDALQTLGASLNNRTAGGNRTAAGTPAAAPAPSSKPGAAAPPPNDGLLADPTEITTTPNNTAAGLGALFNNISSGISGALGGQQQQRGNRTTEYIAPPPGMKSSASTAGPSAFVSLAAAALLAMQLLA